MNAQTDTKDPRAQEAMRRWDELKTERAQHEPDWEELAHLIRPQRGGFAGSNPEQVRHDKPLSSAPIVAQSNFAAGLYGTMCNPANRWMGLRVTDPDLARHHSVKVWTDTVSAIVLQSFAPSVSPFYSSAVQVFADLTTFGNAAHYDEARAEEGRILDVTLSLAQVVVAIDGFGRVVEVVRRFTLTARQAVAMFGDGFLPAATRARAEEARTGTTAYFHHVVENRDWKRGALGPRGKRWLSRYVSEEGCALIREGAYAEMPFHYPRWEVDTGQTYGRGPGQTALPDARVLRQMDAANLRAGQKAADPTLLAPDRDTWALNGRVRPGETVYGGVDMRGNPLVRPLENWGGTGLSLEMQALRIEHIRDAFHWSLMNLAGRTGMTATEIMERSEEKLRLMAPHMGRSQEEFLAPKIARRFGILWREGQIPPPQELAGRDDVGLEVEYLSAAAMAQRSSEGAAVVRILQDVAPLVGIKPRLADRIDEDAMLEVLVEARGAPSKMLRSREEADAIGGARAQAEQAQQLAAAAPAASGVLRDLSAMQGAAA